MQVTKVFVTETAHRLFGYQGACSNIHGHSYKFEVTLQGEELSDNGMVIDFKEIKNNIGAYINDFFDHSLILYKQDPLINILSDVKSYLGDTLKIRVMQSNPTAENMALLLREFIVPFLKTQPREVTLYKIVVWETATSFAGMYGNEKI
jgi:6-pyruvoyltetrahydropterin/6-carboxytetrahydropterin synthase